MMACWIFFRHRWATVVFCGHGVLPLVWEDIWHGKFADVRKTSDALGGDHSRYKDTSAEEGAAFDNTRA